jgi:DNA-directed RNA polymerase I subunit RPA2
MFPAECRQRGLTYRLALIIWINKLIVFRGALTATVELRVNGNYYSAFQTVLGYIPIMLCSSRCHLRGKSEEEMVKAGEEKLERGGYFVCKGSEKVIRLLVGNKRNFPLALVRHSFREKGKMFTEVTLNTVDI